MPAVRRPAFVVRSAIVLALPALLSAACAPPATQSQGTEPVAITPNTVRIETPNGGVVEARTTTEDRADRRTITAKPEVAWAKVPAVFADLGLPVNSYVDATRQIAVKGARIRGRVGKARISSYVQCGADVTGDDKANSYEITLDVTTAIGAAPNGQTEIVTMVIANGRPMSTSGESLRCVSTGALEKRIANDLTLKSATP